MVTAGIYLPYRAQVVGERLLDFPLSTTSQLEADTGLSEGQAKRAIADLRDLGFIDSIGYGLMLPYVQRHRMLGPGLDHFDANDIQRGWHSDGAIGNLVRYDPRRVEAVNSISRLYASDALRLAGIQSYRNDPMAAVAKYASGDEEYGTKCLAFCMPSPAMSPMELFDQLLQIPQTLVDRAEPYNGQFGADLALVAHDQWGATDGLRMATAVLSDWIPAARISAWYYSAGDWHVTNGNCVRTAGPPTALPSIHAPWQYLPPVPNTRRLGPQRFETILRKSPCTEVGLTRLFPLLALLAQYPVVSRTDLNALVGHSPGRKDTARRLRELTKRGLAAVVARRAYVPTQRLRSGVPLVISRRGQYTDRYAVTKAGRDLLWHAFREDRQDFFTRTGLRDFEEHPENWLYRHTDGVYHILGWFRQHGSSVAPGWRAHAYLAGGGRIEPDGVVRLGTPWGLQWCYLELELTDFSVGAFQDRCEKYGSPQRRDPWPLLMVCQNDAAERNFHQAVSRYAPGLRGASTTLRRLRDASGPLDEGVWWVLPTSGEA